MRQWQADLFVVLVLVLGLCVMRVLEVKLGASDCCVNGVSVCVDDAVGVSARLRMLQVAALPAANAPRRACEYEPPAARGAHARPPDRPAARLCCLCNLNWLALVAFRRQRRRRLPFGRCSGASAGRR